MSETDCRHHFSKCDKPQSAAQYELHRRYIGTLSMRKTSTPRCTPVHDNSCGLKGCPLRQVDIRASTPSFLAFILLSYPAYHVVYIPKPRLLITLCSACLFWRMLVIASVASIPREVKRNPEIAVGSVCGIRHILLIHTSPKSLLEQPPS